MTYKIEGLDPAPYDRLFSADERVLRSELAQRVTATSDIGFPCRVSLKDASVGEALILAHHVSNDVQRPFRMAHAIYVREGAQRALPVHDVIPEMLDRRTIGLRAFDADGMMIKATLAQRRTAHGNVVDLFQDADVSYIHAHNAAYGCFLATIKRN